MKRKTSRRASLTVAKLRRLISSHSSVAKKLSHIALSKASPTEPIDCAMPASRQRFPKASDVYCLGSSGRRNSTVLKGFHVPPILLDTRLARATGSRKKEVGS